MGTLRVGVVVPVPPFTQGDGGDPAGLDIDLMSAIASSLGDQVKFVGHENFDALFDALAGGDVDCVTGGATATPEREKRATFAPPYLITGQALAADTGRHPHVHSVDDLGGLTIGVRRGSTGQPIAERLVAEGRAKAVTVCDQAGLPIGDCDAFIALAPVLTELTKPLTGVDVVQKGLSVENVAVAVADHDQQMLSRITVAQAELEEAGTLQQIRRKWLGNPYADQTLAVH
ncbi:ABC transporter substrate-binding protein [Mycolicibacterium baixiangningiae]|uniref:ABC transporter substrate-binding protein n=1 Tax=Mycolicibacterium baixiangningiae TaxID=2761578 RepID=UPI0018D1D669|nr:ABC transporter substrate-binding protein [Mycolicibacterium baixiangningiae]